MPKLPAVSGKKLIRALERGGFVRMRQSGSHVLLQQPDGRVVVIPVHGEQTIPKGTLGAILRDIGISGDELRAML